jgi:dynein light intermediate chain
LIERKAKKRGLCHVRQELHYQLFDEIIRQVTVNEPERGILFDYIKIKRFVINEGKR